MRLQFGILWIEDNYSEAEEEALRAAAGVAGFELNIETSKDGEDLDYWADQQQKYHLFDLVLLDLKLAAGVTGDTLAPIVRTLFRSTPILFYSGSESDDKLRQRMARDCIEGVFCTHRDNFTDRAGEIIADLSLSLNRLSGMRGLSMEVVAQGDNLCREVVISLSRNGSQDRIISDFDQAVCNMASKTLNDFPKIKTVEGKLQSRAVDSMKLFNVFRDQLKSVAKSLEAGPEKDSLQSLIADTRKYREDVIDVRNVLGHAIETQSKDGWQILDKNGEIFMTVRDFPRHRANFLGNLRAIRKIHSILVGEKTD